MKTKEVKQMIKDAAEAYQNLRKFCPENVALELVCDAAVEDLTRMLRGKLGGIENASE